MVDINALAKKAQERKEIFPAVEFSPNGDAKAEGCVYCKFKDVTFTVATNPKPMKGQPADFLTVHVEIVRPTDFGQMPGTYQLQMPATNSLLTDGVMKLWTKNYESLQDVFAKISTYNYNHKKYGLTRGYRVEQITNEDLP